MLAIRLHRAGRRNSSFFRIVLTEKSKPANSGFKKVLGWYNPHTKEASFEKEEILRNVENGAQVSNSLAKILIQNKITHKRISFIPDAAKKPKKDEKKESDKAKDKRQEKPDETEEVQPEPTGEAEKTDETVVAEEQAEEKSPDVEDKENS